MQTSGTNAGIGPMLRVVCARNLDDRSDGQLLSQFFGLRDEGAFAVLVRRHGPMVLGVCRRILGNAADAEDAFQATFIVLLRKAAWLTSRPVLGDWLHGVARRIALKARVAAARRRVKEQGLARPQALAPDHRNDWLPLLDEELGRLPEKYRVPIVLCDLQAHTRREAAQQLGLPEGTVAGQLARGRALLARRLLARCRIFGGVAAPLAGGVVQAAVPAALIRSTVNAAGLLVAGKSLGQAALCPEAISLAKGVMQAMLWNKVRMGVLALVVGALAIAAGGLTFGALTRDDQGSGDGQAGRQAAADVGGAAPVKRQPAARNQSAVEAEGPGDRPGVGPASGTRLLVSFRDNNGISTVTFDPDGKSLLSGSQRTMRRWDLAQKRPSLEQPSTYGVLALAVSPDGKMIALSNGGLLQGQFRVQPGELKLLDAATGKLHARITTPSHSLYSLAFSPDGKTLAAGGSAFDARGRLTRGGVIRLWKVDTLRQAKGESPGQTVLNGHHGFVRSLAFSPDGKLLASASGEAPPPGQNARGEVKLWDLVTGKEAASFPSHAGQAWCVAFSPDGRVLASGGKDSAIRLWDVAARMEFASLNGHKATIVSLAFSPDGATLASAGGDPGDYDAAGELKLWDVAARKEITMLEGHKVTVMSLSFARSGTRLASGSRDGLIHVWEVTRGSSLPMPNGAAGAPRDAGPPSNRTRAPELFGTIATIVPATAAEKKKRILATITLKESKEAVLVMADTELQISRGKLVENASVEALQMGDRVSVWLPGAVKKVPFKAEYIIIFRPGRPDIQRLIEQLGSKVYREREQATVDLERAGQQALPDLQMAEKKTTDLETQRRLGKIIWKLRAPARAEEARQIAALIPQMGDPQFEKRQAAAKQLEAYGNRALSQLFEATLSPDLEIVRRAQATIERILAKDTGGGN
jgi:RNA polymerase sigma factor (sigma-70 family)